MFFTRFAKKPELGLGSVVMSAMFLRHITV